VAAESFAGLTLARVLRPWGRRGEVAAEILTDFPQRLAAIRNAWLSDGRKPPRAVRILSCRIHLGQAIFHFAGSDSINDAELLRGLEVQVPLAERAPIAAGQYYISELVGCRVWEQVARVAGGGEVEGSGSGEPAAASRVDAADAGGGAGEGDTGKGGDVIGDSDSAGGDAGAEMAPLGTVTDVQRIDYAAQGGGQGSGAHGVGSWVLAVATARGELLIPLAAEICTRIDTAARRIEVQLPEGLAGLNQPG
jgi:ribosomal 30S subunit maturation factor RimM